MGGRRDLRRRREYGEGGDGNRKEGGSMWDRCVGRGGGESG